MIHFAICSCQAALKQFSDLGAYFLPVLMAGDDIRILSLNNLFIPLIKRREPESKVSFFFFLTLILVLQEPVVHCLCIHLGKLWKIKARFAKYQTPSTAQVWAPIQSDAQEIWDALIKMVALMNTKGVWASPFSSQVAPVHCSLILLQGLMSTMEFKFAKHLIRLAFTPCY